MYSNIIPPKGKTSIRGAIATHARASRSRKATIATPTEDNADPSEEVPIIQKRGKSRAGTVKSPIERWKIIL